MKDAVDHVLLGLFKRAVLRALFHEVFHRVLGGGGTPLGALAEEEQQPARNGDKGGARHGGQTGEETDAAVTAQQNILGMAERDLLRQEVAKEQHQRGHDENAEHECGGKDLHAREQLLKETPECGSDEESDAEPHEETHAGDACLRHGNRLCRMFEQCERLRSVIVAALGEAFETAAVRFGERCLNLRKIRVCHETDDEENQADQIG